VNWTSIFRRPIQRPTVPESLVVYAVGDMHGRADLADLLLGVVETEADDGAASVVLIGLGDYVDRGPQTRELVDKLVTLRAHGKIESHFLLGNHEQIMLAFLSDPKAGPAWCEFGGRETLMSYGVTPPEDPMDAAAWEQASQAFNAALPETHRAFFNSLSLSHEVGDYVFVHAGFRPGVPLEAQTEEDMLWIRRPFLNDRRPFSKVVVHGHSPTLMAHIDDRRIGLDTRAYATHVLSALRLEASSRALVQTFAKSDSDFGLMSMEV
jgi:serine/threonine protein phosphatase 1